MPLKQTWFLTIALVLSFDVFADCTILEEAKQLDPVEVGYCESDAVFVGKVEQRIETARGIREEGSDRTIHTGTETSTVRVLASYKGTLSKTVTMVANLYDKNAAFSFEKDKQYLVFAKRLTGENEYAGASPVCSVQPTLLLVEAQDVLKQLDQHKNGRKRIDCAKIRTKAHE